MSTYIIGDVQGCFDSLQALLKHIHFNPAIDRLGFVGDLVNRGPKSLETLRFLMCLKNPLIVLGNHDLHLMVLYYYLKTIKHHEHHSIPHNLHAILEAPDCHALIQFLLQQSFLIHEKNFVMVHAGIPPQWSIKKASQLSAEVQKIMCHDPNEFFKHLFGNHPTTWHDQLIGWDRIRYIVNALTRLRFCTKDGVLDLENKTDQTINKTYQPWFSWVHPKKDIYFGHWASLNGVCNQPNIYALDTGCAWGHQLTAIRLGDKKRFSVESVECTR